MNLKELRTLFSDMQKNGMTAMLCDTAVPFYDVGVSCGRPNDVGDIPPEMVMMPGMLTMGLVVFMTRARGDSMEGVGIHSGDLLMLENTQHYRSHDIVLASIDGEEMLKSYYIDEEGRHWLVASNDNYEPLQLTEEMNVKFCGRLVWHLAQPRETTRNMHKAVTRYLSKQTDATHTLTYDEVTGALRKVGPQVTAGRHWLGPCRVLMDCEYVPKDGYESFCELVHKTLPSHPHLPSAKELQRMAVMCFSKPFLKWTDRDAPVHGRYYKPCYHAGAAMLDSLPITLL